MFISIICAKIFYGNTPQDVLNHIATYRAQITNNRALNVDDYLNNNPYFLNNISYVQMTDEQFVRFKNAGRRHESKTPNKFAGLVSRTRNDRTYDPALQKWDVDEYSGLTGRSGPWGNRSLTNRDHMIANSSLQMQNNNLPANVRDTPSAVKNSGLAITVSGRHHREASYTYGGRTKQASPINNLNRTEYGAAFPTEAFNTEMNAMLQWKSNHMGKNNQQKNTLRLEMVGAYFYMYKKSVDEGHINPTIVQDAELVLWAQHAVNNDHGQIHRF